MAEKVSSISARNPLASLSEPARFALAAGAAALAPLLIALPVGFQIAGAVAAVTGLITVVRPFGDVVVITVRIPAVLKGTARRRGRLLLLLAGFAGIAFSDAAYAVLTASGTTHARVEVFDLGWVIGFLLIALAPLWPLRAETGTAEEQPASLLQVAVPLLSLVLVATTTLVVTGTGRKMDVWISFPGASLGILLTVSQLLTHRDSLALLTQSTPPQPHRHTAPASPY